MSFRAHETYSVQRSGPLLHPFGADVRLLETHFAMCHARTRKRSIRPNHRGVDQSEIFDLCGPDDNDVLDPRQLVLPQKEPQRTSSGIDGKR